MFRLGEHKKHCPWSYGVTEEQIYIERREKVHYFGFTGTTGEYNMEIEKILTCQHTIRVLHKAGISTVEELEKLSYDDLLKIRGIGKVIAGDVIEIMRQRTATLTDSNFRCS